uniref:T9SS C-terminal target domain-containing protein n=1 Tax=Prevotella sp. GTC17260 TaxID=3236796 RepID=A0AB33JF41_9BACT
MKHLALVSLMLGAAMGCLADNYTVIAMPVVAYSTTANSLTSIGTQPVVSASGDEALIFMGNIVPAEQQYTTDIARLEKELFLVEVTADGIKVTAGEHKHASVILFDSAGQTLAAKRLEGGQASFAKPRQGVYVVKAGQRVRKIIVP